MTSPEQIDDASVPPDLGIVAAFLDGEPVDGGKLKRALASDAARDYFLDVLVLRRVVTEMGPMTLVRAPRRRAARLRRWAAAALVAGMAGAAGYVMGERPGPVADVRGAGSSVEAVVDVATPRAPRPTHVIRLESGLTWHTEGGD